MMTAQPAATVETRPRRVAQGQQEARSSTTGGTLRAVEQRFRRRRHPPAAKSRLSASPARVPGRGRLPPGQRWRGGPGRWWRRRRKPAGGGGPARSGRPISARAMRAQSARVEPNNAALPVRGCARGRGQRWGRGGEDSLALRQRIGRWCCVGHRRRWEGAVFTPPAARRRGGTPGHGARAHLELVRHQHQARSPRAAERALAEL